MGGHPSSKASRSVSGAGGDLTGAAISRSPAELRSSVLLRASGAGASQRGRGSCMAKMSVLLSRLRSLVIVAVVMNFALVPARPWYSPRKNPPL